MIGLRSKNLIRTRCKNSLCFAARGNLGRASKCKHQSWILKSKVQQGFYRLSIMRVLRRYCTSFTIGKLSKQISNGAHKRTLDCVKRHTIYHSSKSHRMPSNIKSVMSCAYLWRLSGLQVTPKGNMKTPKARDPQSRIRNPTVCSTNFSVLIWGFKQITYALS